MNSWIKSFFAGAAGAIALAFLTAAFVAPVQTVSCTSGQFVNALAASGAFTCGTPTGGGGGGTGLWNQIISATPTGSSTGFGSGTWLNQGSAAESNIATGYSLESPSGGNAENFHGKYKAVPSTPYTIKILLASQIDTVANTFPEVGFGWTDGTKLHVLVHSYRNVGAPPYIDVGKWTNSTTFSAFDNGNCSGGATAAFFLNNPNWVYISDDGTNVTFGVMIDGVSQLPCFTVAKASGFLGSSGYTNIYFGVDSMNAKTWGTLMSYSQ